MPNTDGNMKKTTGFTGKGGVQRAGASWQQRGRYVFLWFMLILICVGLVATWIRFLMLSRTRNGAQLALIYLQEARLQRERHQDRLSAQLVYEAQNLLDQTHKQTQTRITITSLEGKAISQLQRGAHLPENPVLQMLLFFAVFLIVVVYWVEERRLSRLGAEQQTLRDKLLTISSGWTVATVRPGSVQRFIEHMLHQITKYTPVESAQVLHRVSSGEEFRFESFGISGLSKIAEHLPIPQALLTLPSSGISRVLRYGEPWYSGNGAENGSVLPGVAIP